MSGNIDRRSILRMGLAATLGMPLIMASSRTAFSARAGRGIVHRDPSCGCCEAWIAHMRENGFDLEIREAADLMAEKARLGVPAPLQSCHTAEIGGYVIEGHVPAKDVRRLLEEKPQGLGLSVPGMPVGAPGMEMGDQIDPYRVFLWDNSGQARVFAVYGVPV